MRRCTTVLFAATLLAGLALTAAPAAANTAYSNVFTLDLRTANPGAVLVKTALDDLEAAAVSRIDRDRDELSNALAHLFLVMDGKHGKQAIQAFLDAPAITMSQFDATVRYIFEGSAAAGDFASVGAGIVSNLIVQWAVNRAEAAQAEYFRSVFSVYNGLWGTRDFVTVRNAIRARLDSDFTHGGQTLGFAEAKRRIRSRIAAAKAEIDRVRPGASFPGAELAAMIGIAAQSLRDSMDAEAPLLYYDSAAGRWVMTLSGNSRYWASTAKALYDSDKSTQRWRFWRTVGISALALGKTAVAIVTAVPTAGASVGVWAVTEKAVLAGLTIGATWSAVSHEAANLENNRAAAMMALDYLDSALGELSEIDTTFTYRAATHEPLVPAVDRLVRSYLAGQGSPLDGYSVEVSSFTGPSQVTSGSNGLAAVSGSVTIRNTGTRSASPSPLVLVDAWTGEGYHKVAVGDLGENRTLGPGQSHSFNWRSTVPAFSLVPSKVNLVVGFGPQLVRVVENGAQQFLVLPPGSSGAGGSVSQVPVGAGRPGTQPAVHNHTPSGATAYTTYVLEFAYGDLDLHVYDNLNRHQGMNYSTGSVDRQIPGAVGPDPRANPEAIRVPVSPGVTYRIEVVDRAARGAATTIRALQVPAVGAGALAVSVENSYRVVAIEEASRPPLLELSPASRTTLHGETQAVVESVFTIQEVGLHAAVTGIGASMSPLVGSGGDVISPSSVAVVLEKSRLEPGEQGEVRVVVPMSGRGAYPYRGTLTVTSSAGSRSAEITIDADGVRLHQAITANPRHFLISSSGHTAGAGGTVWRSDAVIHNPGTTTATVHLFFLKREQPNASARGKRLTIPAGASVKLEDVVRVLFGETGTAGAILVASDADLLVTSRTFNNAASGTYGQYIEGYPVTQAIGPNQAARLIQLTKNSSYRTNIGVANASGEALTVTVDIYRAKGSSLGTRSYTVHPYGYYQEANPIHALTSSDVDDAYAIVKSATPGARYFTYASVIDNRTGDPIQVVPVAAASSEPIFLPAAARVAGMAGTNWRSDLQLHNPGSTSAAYTIALLRRDQDNSSPATRSYTLGPGQSVRYSDVVGSLFGATGAAGLRITPTSGTVSATMRTYNDQPSGTFGQFIAGQLRSAAITAGQQARVVQLAESASTTSGFRTNLGLLNASASTTVVEIRLNRGDGSLVGTTSRSLPPFAFHQIDRIFTALTSADVPDGFAVLSTPTAGGAFFAYASVVDNRSGDPITIPARVVSGTSCTFVLSPTSRSHGAGAETGTVSVTAASGCAWTAASNAAWITITGGASGSGNGTVTYSVAANTGAARSGTLTIAGQTFTVNQAGGCAYTITPTSASIGAGGATGQTVSVTAASGCAWTATSNAAWITITGGASGSGNGTVTYNVAANTGAARSGTLAIAGQTFTVNQAGGSAANEITVMLPGNVPLVMVKVPAGTFLMGSPESERGRNPDESPQHQVTISQDYYMGKYEVTQRQWVAIMGSNPSYFTSCGLDCPVEQVSWNDICGGSTGSTCTSTSFIGKLNAHLQATGQPGAGKFRLPTEAEWERAARGGTTGPFSFDTSANPNWDTGCGTFPQALPYMWWCGNNTPYGTKPVGQKNANPYGLYDMHGNVWEWVGDWSGPYPSGAVTDPTGPTTGSDRVPRGGNWSGPAQDCRSATRASNHPDLSYHGLGFRLARSL